jgi:two-component system, sensor histidine kinase YesM
MNTDKSAIFYRGLKKTVFLNKSFSLKKSLVVMLLISSLIPTVLIGVISYYSIHGLMKNKIENVMLNDIKQVRIRFESALHNLDEVSKQLAFDSRIVNDIDQYLRTGDVLEKFFLSQKINGSLNLINDTSYNLGMMFYYFPDKDEAMFSGLKLKRDFKMDKLPLFTEEKGVLFYGPHETAYAAINNKVFSVARKVDISDQECYVYLETNYRLFGEILSKDRKTFNISYIILSDTGMIVYSDAEAQFPVGNSMEKIKPQEKHKEKDGNYFFMDEAAQGWQIISIINKKEYNQAVYEWFARFVLISFGSLLISFIFGMVIWYVVYKPLKKLHSELSLISESKFNSEVKLTGISEFDELLEQFKHTRQRVVELLSEVEQKERAKSHLEVEKLMHQINPHFLHNTLNTIQWIARMNGQDEIDRLVALFTKVLHYNLGKEGGLVTIEEEIEALNNYINLQKIRYDYEFNVHIDLKEEIQSCRIPRFILQPLVENALYHGLRDDYGVIEVEVIERDGQLNIEVKDNGEGMTEEEIRNLLSGNKSEKKSVGMGIGISYVDRMIKIHYGSKGKMEVLSTPGEGTAFRLTIPLMAESPKNSIGGI